jgi:hypothetical protein
MREIHPKGPTMYGMGQSSMEDIERTAIVYRRGSSVTPTQFFEIFAIEDETETEFLIDAPEWARNLVLLGGLLLLASGLLFLTMGLLGQ